MNIDVDRDGKYFRSESVQKQLTAPVKVTANGGTAAITFYTGQNTTGATLVSYL